MNKALYLFLFAGTACKAPGLNHKVNMHQHKYKCRQQRRPLNVGYVVDATADV